jgi:hypothetical protein
MDPVLKFVYASLACTAVVQAGEARGNQEHKIICCVDKFVRGHRSVL